ncbi:MAG: TonB-dependent receptor, partial [Fusobacteriaceae bacterium]|nr:TonB-dependent receptor [Fusobacteriaceae bacterium]
MKKNLLALLAISVVLVAADDEKFIVELEKTSVTAQKFETNVRETSKNITVISEDEIKKSGAKSVVDLLKTVPGLFVGTGFGSGTVDFRGQGESAKNNVLVLVNGVSINTIDMAGPDFSIIDVSNIESIEIIPSGGVVYGDKAVGGVINIITKSEGSSVKLETGSFGYETFGANINERIGDFAIHTDFSRTLKDGYRNNSNFRKDNFGLGLGYDINENNRIKFDYAYNESDMNYAGSLTEAQLTEDRAQVGSKSSIFSKKNSYSLAYIYDKDNLNIENTTSYNQKNSDYDYSGYQYGTINSYLNNNFKVKYNYKNNSLISGIDVSEGNSKTDGTNKITKNQLGIFALDTYKFTDNLNSNVGFRNENVKLSYSSGKEKTYNENLISLGTNYLYSDTGSVYASFEQNYRTPVTDEYTYGTSDLKSQLSNNLELGIREYIGNTYLTVSIFNTITQNEIYFNPANGYYGTNENIDGNTERNGLELSTKNYVGEFTISQAYTYLNAKIKDGVYEEKTIPWVPKNKYSIRTDYKINDISIGAEYLYIGSLYSVSDWNN